MKNAYIFIFVFILICTEHLVAQGLLKTNADSIVQNIQKYKNTNVVTEGVIVHVCGVDGKKMKLKTEGGAIIKVVYADSLKRLDKSFYKNRVNVQGVVKETRIGKAKIDLIEKEKTILCHIDNTSCKDTAWVRAQEQAGNAATMSDTEIAKLRSLMVKSNKDYVSVITIFAEKVEIIDDFKH